MQSTVGWADNRSMRPGLLRLSVLLAPLLVVAPLAAVDSDPPSLGRPRPCARAQLIDGALRCDEELLDDAIAACPGGPARTLEPGDSVAFDWGACMLERMPAEQLAALGQIVDINTASAAEIASLPGIGPVIAGRIVAGRPYASVDELLEVRGIGDKRLEALRPRARVRPRSR